ncbi:MAG: hypothetical protein KC431_25590, partial [Myxococcales bacterium]|nr:hypothetical protein [Myxococcales bacterium]
MRDAKELCALDAKRTKFTTMWSTHDLRRCLPNFHWGMIFGPPYIDLFGRDVLLSAPAHRVRELPSGQILIQLTEDLRDLETDYPRVAAARERVKDYLGRDAFWSPAMATYRAPTFTFPETGQVLPPAKNPRDVCDDLIRLLCKDADLALRANKLEYPNAWYSDHREQTVAFPWQSEGSSWLDDSEYPTFEAKRARYEQLFQQTRVVTAGGTARPDTVPTAKGPEPALLIHVEHKSGYGRRLALPYKP